MKIEKLALVGAIICGVILSAEDKKPAPASKLTPEAKAAIAVANTKLVSARLREAESKQNIQVQAQQAVERAVQVRQASEAAYQAELSKILKPLGLEGCTVTEEAEIGDCPPEKPSAPAKAAK
jgi:hypothetical protein